MIIELINFKTRGIIRKILLEERVAYMDKKDILLKEIDLIQNCIERMAKNSFVVKGWLISLLAVMLALLPEKFSIKYLSIAGFLSIICFWYLDGFFLKTETLYRWKYEWVTKNRLSCDDYTFDLNPYNVNMWLPNIDGTGKKEPSIFGKMISKTMFPLYVPLSAIMMLLFFNSILFVNPL